MEPEQTPVAPQEFEAAAAVARRLAENISRAVQIHSRQRIGEMNASDVAVALFHFYAPLELRAW